MSDAWRVASITSFEQVAAGPSIVLLRVAATAADSSSLSPSRPILLADDGINVSRFAAIPAPPDASGELRCAYSVPSEAVTQEVVFSLEFEDGFVIALPQPATGAARLNRRTAPQDAAPPTTSAGEPEERRLELGPKLSEQSAELADLRREIGELRSGAAPRQALPEQTLHLHLEAIQARAESEARRDLLALASESAPALGAGDPAQTELETWSAELERRLAETTTELADARTQLAARSAVGAEDLSRLSDAAVGDAERRAEQELGASSSSDTV